MIKWPIVHRFRSFFTNLKIENEKWVVIIIHFVEKMEIWNEKMKKKMFNFFITILQCSLIFLKAIHAIYIIERLIIMELYFVKGVLVKPYFDRISYLNTILLGPSLDHSKKWRPLLCTEISLKIWPCIVVVSYQVVSSKKNRVLVSTGKNYNSNAKHRVAKGNSLWLFMYSIF